MKIYFCEDCVDIQKAKAEALKRRFPCDDISIEYLSSGQPILTKDGEQSGYISISHTYNALVMAFGDKPVGIDIERKSRKVSAKVCESIEEWTKREAYGKYIGVGINKEVLSAQLPDKIINTFYHGEYVVSVCGEEYNEGIKTLIDNASFE